MSVVAAFLWPNTYVSSATIKVQPQQIPEAFVQSNVNQQIAERVNTMAQQVLSRTALTTVIQTFDLYPRDRARLPMEDVIEKMKKDIQIGQVASFGSAASGRTVPAFQIIFAYTDRFKAQKVVSEFTTRFIDQSIRDQSTVNKGTEDLLRDQWDAAKKEMEDIDAKLAEFKVRHAGSLPEQESANLAQLNALQTRLMNLNGAVSRVTQEKLSMETQLRITRDQLNAIKEPVSPETLPMSKSEKLQDAERDVSQLEKNLAALREHYKDTYPQIQTTISALKTAKSRLDQAQKEEHSRRPEMARANPMIARDVRETEANIKRIQGLIDSKTLEGEEYQKEISQVNRAIQNFQSRLEGIPQSDRGYTELTRDRDIAKARFLDLEAKMNKAGLAGEMNKRKFGESLEVLDPASLPQTPARPQREVWIAVGAVIGLGVGLMLTAGREAKDTSLKNLKDVRAYTQLPILGSIPLLENDLVVKRRKRMTWLGWSLAAVAGMVMMAGSVVYYFVTKV